MVKYVARYADPELYELVNHLRSELSEQNEEMLALQAKNDKLQAEVDLMRRMDTPTYLAFAERDAEIERLREDLEYTQTLMRDGAEQRQKDVAEIERLREDVKYYRELLRAAKVPEWVTIFRKTIV